MKQRRDKNGKIRDSLLQRFKSWKLGRDIRKGKLPRGRTSKEVMKAIQDTIPSGEMGEIWGILSVRVFRGSTVEDFGVMSTRKVTTAFRDYIVDSLQNSTTAPMDVFKYHGCGTGGNTAEANTQTALTTEVGSRVAGTQIEGATADIFKTVATITPGGSYAIDEHGVFSASSGGTMMDRSVFSDINVGASDSIEFTYEITFNAEA